MLVEFSVSNFRSIGERITFSSVASASSGKRPDISIETGNSFAPNVLTSAVILGANASGKSSIIGALSFLKKFVLDSAAKSPDDEIPVISNLLSSRFRNGRSEFEIIFIQDSELYQYGFILNKERVYEEWLFVRSAKRGSRVRSIFQRSFDDNGEYSWELNENVLPSDKEVWKRSTRSNALFLSTAVQLNSKFLKTLYDWFRRGLRVIESNKRIAPDYTAELLSNERTKKTVEAIITSLDLQIKDFRILEEEFEIPPDVKEIFSPTALKRFQEHIRDRKTLTLHTTHETEENESIELKFEEESDGTQAIIGLAGPILNVIERGYTLFVDELSNSLHPLALRAIVKLFNDRDINDRGAQLFFTSHETSIISKGFMHRDQIWFVQKPDGLYSQLIPLSDFKVRDVEAFQRSYLGGRFGAIPNLKSVKNAFKKRQAISEAETD